MGGGGGIFFFEALRLGRSVMPHGHSSRSSEPEGRTSGWPSTVILEPSCRRVIGKGGGPREGVVRPHQDAIDMAMGASGGFLV